MWTSNVADDHAVQNAEDEEAEVIWSLITFDDDDDDEETDIVNSEE